MFITELLNKRKDTNYQISRSGASEVMVYLLNSDTESEKGLLLAEDIERLCLIVTTGLEMWPLKSDTSDGCHSYH